MNHRTRLAALALAGVAAAPAAAQAPRTEGPLTHAPAPTTGAIRAEDLRTHVYVLAADSMKGRETGTRGNVMGTDYIADQARRIGLQPGGENGTFFQQVPLVESGTDAGATLTVDGAALALGRDYLLVPSYGDIIRFAPTLRASGVQAVYGGRVGPPTAMISPEQARGKLVVFAAPMGPNGQPSFGFWAAGTFERYADAAGVVFATLDYTQGGLREFMEAPRTELEKGAPASDRRDPPGLIVTKAAAERLMGAPLAGLQVGAPGRTVNAAVAMYRRPLPFPSRNVVAILPGSDPALRGQYVALGAHNDHVGVADQAVDHDSLVVFNRILRPQGAEEEPAAWTDETRARFRAELAQQRARHGGAVRLDSVYNGADDDASGSAGLLEIAQYLASRPTRPRRSVIFVWHAAEEVGLYGSEWFTDHPTVPLDSIVAQLNMDMIGRGAAGDGENGGPAHLELVGSRRLSTQLGDLVEEVNRSGNHGFAFDYSMDANGHPLNIYCRSDHYNYARYGVPVTFFTTGGHSDYHMLTDEPQYIEYDKMARVAQLIASVAEAVANRDARLVVDKPKPDPHAQCQQ